MRQGEEMEVIKAIVPAAGLGTRFLPWTKSIPREMLPLLGKPAIHYVAEEALRSGIKHLVFIANGHRQSLSDYFDVDAGLDQLLQEHGKSDLVASINSLRARLQFSYVIQSEPLGLGHAVLCAEHVIGKEYFAVMLPDDIIVGPKPGLDQLIRIARQECASVIAVQEVPQECVSSYGIISVKKQVTTHLMQVAQLVEKPSIVDAPSRLAVVGRYVLSNKVFSSLRETATYATGELQLTNAIAHMVRNGEKVYAYKVDGIRYDTGTVVGWLKAIFGLALQNPEYAPHVKRFIEESQGIDSFLYNPNKTIDHMVEK
jgi:UTP--glucose-1-phosphate uridylyltransferase